jgi:multidrug resistance efflux pump
MISSITGGCIRWAKISETESIILPNVPAISGEKPAQEPSVRKRREKTGKQQFKKKKKNKLRTIVLLVVAVLVLGGGGYGVYRLFFYEEPVEVVTGTTVRDTIETLIEGTAVTSPTSFQMLTVPVDGVVDKVFVSQGDTVEVGDPLYSIDGDSIEEDLADLEATIADYEDQLAELYESVDSLTISAPFSGKLLDVAVENGDEVGASTAVATLVDDSKMILELYYSVAYRDYITKGMDAEVSISQYMTTLSGTVTAQRMSAT